jgi:hypothetical protein
MRNSLFAGFIIIVLIFIYPYSVAIGSDFLGMEVSRNMELKGVRIPLESEGHRIGEVTIEEVVMGARRFDVMLISVIPQPVMRQMKIEVDQIQESSEWRQALHVLFRGNQILRQGRIESIRLDILSAKGNIRVEAREGHYGRSGVLILRDATITRGEKTSFLPQFEIPLQVVGMEWLP